MSAYPSAPPPRPQGGRSGFDNFLASVRRMGIWRTDDRWMGGVAAGIAHRLGVDPLLIRGAFVVAGLLGGVGFLIYGIAWLLLPEAADGRIHLQEASYGRVTAGFVGSVIMGVIGLIGMPPFIGVTGGWGSIVIAIMLVVALVVALPALASSPGRRPSGAPGSPWAPPYDAAPPHPYPPSPSAGPGGPGGPGSVDSVGGPGAGAPGVPDAGIPTAPAPSTKVPGADVPDVGGTGMASPGTGAGAAGQDASVTGATLASGAGGPGGAAGPGDAGAAGDTAGTTQAFATGSGPGQTTRVSADAAVGPSGYVPTPPNPSPPGPHPPARGTPASGAHSPWRRGGAAGVPLVQPIPYSPAAAPIAPTVAPPGPPRPVHARRQRPGGVVWATVLAFALFIVAGVMLLDRRGAGVFGSAYAPALAVGGVLALLGIAIVGLSMLGRRIGGMTACAILVMVLGLPTLAVVDATSRISWGPAVGQTVWEPSGTADLRGQYELGIGDAVLDLSETGPILGKSRTVDFEVGIGQARLILPPDVSTRVIARVDIGDVRTTLPAGWEVTRGRSGKAELAFGSNASVGGVGNGVTARSPEFVENGGPTLEIRVSVSIGHLSIYQGEPS